MAARAFQRSSARGLLPQSVAVLGEASACVLHEPSSRRFFELPLQPGTVLASSADGRVLFFLRPRRGASRPVTPRDQAIRALELHERFVHRRADGFYNCAVPPFRDPIFRGELVILRYHSDKEIEADDDVEPGEIVEYEHYFENPGSAPAYPDLWSVGAEQFIVPRGPFRVEADGIEYARP